MRKADEQSVKRCQMFNLTNGHAEFVGDEQDDAETKYRPADDTAVAQPFHSVRFECQSGNDGRNCSDDNQPEKLGAGVLKTGNKPGFENAFGHLPNFFRKVNHNGHD